MRAIIITLILTFAGQSVFAQFDWKLKKDEDGIKIFTRPNANSNFKSVKVECNVKCRMAQLVAFLLDVDKQPDWVYNTKLSKIVKMVSPSDLIFYSEVDVPWPCTNRDYIAHIAFNQVTPQYLTIDSRAEPNLLPQKEGKIRVKTSIAHWDVTSLNHDLQHIIYTVQFDPSGAVPAWLTNLFLTKGPLNTFQKLRECVSRPEYVHAHVDFIKE